MVPSRKARFALTLVAVILIPGFADYALASAGYKTLAGIVWTAGYGFGILVVWYRWIRPLDLSGPSGDQTTNDEDPHPDIDSASGDTPSS